MFSFAIVRIEFWNWFKFSRQLLENACVPLLPQPTHNHEERRDDR